MRAALEMAGGAALACAVIGAGVALGGNYAESEPERVATVAPAPTLTIDLPDPCEEDDPCWTWPTMGHHNRGVYVRGQLRVVNACTYRKLRVAGLLDARTERLRGDAWAVKHGCGDDARLAVHPTGVVEG